MNNWRGLIVATALALFVWLIAVISSTLVERKLQKKGILPVLKETTDDDIVRLAKSGYKIWAIKRYRQLYNVSLKEAKQKVEALN